MRGILLNWNPGSQERLDFTELFAPCYKFFLSGGRVMFWGRGLVMFWGPDPKTAFPPEPLTHDRSGRRPVRCQEPSPGEGDRTLKQTATANPNETATPNDQP